MSGVEAAASLFGGTEAEDRDLFATLGADTTSTENTTTNDDHDLFGSSTRDTPFLQDQSNIQPYQTTTKPYEPSYQYTPTNNVTADNNWNQQNSYSTTSGLYYYYFYQAF